MEELKQLIGQDLGSFKLLEMTEVYHTDDQGFKSSTVGFFKDEMIAKAFAGQTPQKGWGDVKTKQTLVFTNGTKAYAIEQASAATLFDDEQEALAIKKKALEKLTPEERKLFGF